MDDKTTTFSFPLGRTLPFLASFFFLLLIIIGGLGLGGYHPLVTAFLWLALIGSAWYGLSDLLFRVVVEIEGLHIRSLSLRGLRTSFVPWLDVQTLSLAGPQPDLMKLGARNNVSITRWTLPAHRELAQIVVQRAKLEAHKDNKPPGVTGAFDKLLSTKSKQKRYPLHWQWRRMERELEDE